MKLLRKLLEDNKKAISNLMNTLALGRNADLIMDKTDELKAEQSDLEYKIAKEESVLFKLSKEEIAATLCKIRDADTTTFEHKQRFIDTFVYKIYYYDDKKVAVLINIDGTADTNEISVSDIGNAVNSDSVSDQEKRTYENSGSHKSNLAERVRRKSNFIMFKSYFVHTKIR